MTATEEATTSGPRPPARMLAAGMPVMFVPVIVGALVHVGAPAPLDCSSEFEVPAGTIALVSAADW